LSQSQLKIFFDAGSRLHDTFNENKGKWKEKFSFSIEYKLVYSLNFVIYKQRGLKNLAASREESSTVRNSI